ncbi:MAG: 3-octaprenyl-4-hydroxybenzoate carboxy-lyase, partial [Chitinophagaceae bacterium]|nr:3-octaprenyl-4-hydroxybenzoate carboxy-lyase [Chitinophagaceae bacterium]
LKNLQLFENPKLIIPGIIALQTKTFRSYENTTKKLVILKEQLKNYTDALENFPLIIVCDDSDFVSEKFNNFLWVTFTRSNPSHDIYGVNEFTQNKHWGCEASLIIDARIKPHHAPPLVKDPAVEKKIDRLFEKGGSLYGMG